MQAYNDWGGLNLKKSFPFTTFFPLISVGHNDTNKAPSEM